MKEFIFNIIYRYTKYNFTHFSPSCTLMKIEKNGGERKMRKN